MPARLLLLSLLLCAASPARAYEPDLPTPRHFGDEGQVVPFGAVSFSYQHYVSILGYDASSMTTFGASPGVLYFVADNFAAGAFVDADVQTGAAPGNVSVTSYELGFVPTIAYNFRLSNRASFFPRLYLGVDYIKDIFPIGANGSGGPFDSWLFKTGIDFDFLFHVSPNFFVGGGPYVVARFQSGNNYASSISVGAETVIGGWF